MVGILFRFILSGKLSGTFDTGEEGVSEKKIRIVEVNKTSLSDVIPIDGDYRKINEK